MNERERNERCQHGVQWPHECKECLYGESSASPACSNALPISDGQRQAISNLAHCVRSSRQKLPKRMRDYAESVIKMLEDGRI